MVGYIHCFKHGDVYRLDTWKQDKMVKIGEEVEFPYKKEELSFLNHKGIEYVVNIGTAIMNFNVTFICDQEGILEVEILGDTVLSDISKIIPDPCSFITNKIKPIKYYNIYEALKLSNTRYGNLGVYNIGEENIGSYNMGNKNCSWYNIGDKNTGRGNCGNCNTGFGNFGDYNSGGFNKGNFNTGYFNTMDYTSYLFNKPIDLPMDKVSESKGILILKRDFRLIEYNEKEKISLNDLHSKYTYKLGTGMRVKHYSDEYIYETTWKKVWENLTDLEKQEVFKIPNFDKEIFNTITGLSI